MEHFYESIEGWFDYSNIYSQMVETASTGSHFVEIGSYYGRSAAFMLVEIVNSGKNIKLDCVDPMHQETVHTNLSRVEGHYTHKGKPSVEAAADYEDASIDFVWIDGNHDYEAVIDDINSWLPKLKTGGWMGGHDYNHPGHPGVKQACDELIPNHKEIPSSIPDTPHGNVTSWLWQKPQL